MDEIKRLYQASKALMIQGEYAAAAKGFKSVLSFDNTLAPIHYNLASCYVELGEWNGAYLHYQYAAEHCPDAVTFFNLGVVSEKRHHVDQAREYYEQALAHDPDYFDAHYNLGLLCLSADQPARAKKHLQACLILKPTDSLVQFQLARLNEDSTQFNRVPSVQVEKLFDDYAENFDAHLVGALSYDLPQKMVASVLSDLSSQPICDLGCGTGLVGEAIIAALPSAQIEGVDLSRGMLKQAEAKGCYRALVQADIEVFLQDTRKQYDWVFAADVLNYIGSLDAVLSGVKSVLGVSGGFVFSIELGQHLEQSRLTRSGRFTHNPTAVAQLAESKAFQVESFEVTGRLQVGERVAQSVFILRHSGLSSSA